MQCSGRWKFENAVIVTVAVLCFVLTTFAVSSAQSISPDAYSRLQWRMIGPFRAGRITCVAGVTTQPNLYYMGTPGGGVWKTTDAGNTWTPIFDDVKVASIGAIGVSESNPNIIYVGTGEQIQGNGVYKSMDGGATWTNIGLQQTHEINSVLVDPRDPDRVLVGAAGDSTSGDERGVYKTTDGGKHWQKTLFRDQATSVMDMTLSPGAPEIVYAALQHRQPGPPTGAPRTQEQDASIYKSTDAGSTWTPVGGKGLPTEAMGRVGVAVTPGSGGKTLYAIMTQGLFRSDDGGATWTRSTTDPRVVGNGYFSRVFVDPKNAGIIYVAQTSMYKSSDGGKTFDAEFGAPSGDDYHNLWINPQDTNYMIAGVDQGAIVSVNGGKTWSSWYNQPTGQFYHVSTDNRYPYYVYGAQQDSGTAAVPSRSDFGEITYRDWAPTGGFEFAYIAADPLNPNYVYTGGWYGSVLRFDRLTGQVVHVFVRSPRYRTVNMAPIQFSPQDPHVLYVGSQYVMRTSDGGNTWQEVSPDLTLKRGAAAANGRTGAPPVAISSMALSPLSAGVIWAGTSNGLIHVTQNGKTWQAVTPNGLPERSNIVALEASHHDAGTAYVVVNAFRNLHPFVFRTRDFGKSWQPITTGLPPNAIARVVRDDPKRRGLLYAGTEDGAWVSFDDGDHWQTLQMNLPTTSVRDLAVHGNDLVAATFGRALWILDDISPLRQLTPAVLQSGTHLFEPTEAVRTRWDMNQDTPLPVETPAAKNPPDGAIIDYYLQSPVSGEMKLSILDAQNNVVRQYSSQAQPQDKTPKNAPEYWFAAPAVLSNKPGLNRFVWDLRYAPPKTMRYSYFGNKLDYIEYTLAEHAIPGETPVEQPQGPLAVPGTYTVALEAGGKTVRQPLKVTMDPRVRVSPQDLAAQLNVTRSISSQMAVTYDGYDQAERLRVAVDEGVSKLQSNANASEAIQALRALDQQITTVQEGVPTEPGFGPSNRELARLMSMVQSGDARPASVLQDAVNQSCSQVTARLEQWRKLNSDGVQTTNSLLQKYNVGPLPSAAQVPANPMCAK